MNLKNSIYGSVHMQGDQPGYHLARYLVLSILVFPIVLLLALAGMPSSQAEGVRTEKIVGNGAPGSCSEAALNTALVGGGDIAFNCGPSPVIITVTSQKSILTTTSLDGGDRITISGGNATEIFFVTSQAVTLTLANLTLSDGKAALAGGAIVNQGTLNVLNSTFTANSAGWVGGAIDNLGTAYIVNSKFLSNSAERQGGAIRNATGTLQVINSTFEANSAESGGGIQHYSDATASVSGSTFYNNTSRSGGGGGINNYGTIIVTNSTFLGNTASGGGVGGGICNLGSALTVINSTFAGNGAAIGGAIYGGSSCNPGDVILKNTILAESTSGGNCDGITAAADGGGNLRWPRTDASCVGAFGDPKLLPLAENGGPTRTMALQLGSAAINTGDDTVCVMVPVNGLDQRGVGRPQGAHCDAGAYEYNRSDRHGYLPLVLRNWPPPPPIPTPTPIPAMTWLEYLNYHRAQANLSPVTENPSLSDGCQKHSRYMVKNNWMGHDEDPANPWYTPEGQAAAPGNVLLGRSVFGPFSDRTTIDAWMASSSHRVRMMNPALRQVGYGNFYQPDAPDHNYGATLDVVRGLEDVSAGVVFPFSTQPTEAACYFFNGDGLISVP